MPNPKIDHFDIKKEPIGGPPELFISISNLLNSFFIFLNTLEGRLGFATSPSIAKHFILYLFLILLVAFSNFFYFLIPILNYSPLMLNIVRTEKPIPSLPPVTKATFLESFFMICFQLRYVLFCEHYLLI